MCGSGRGGRSARGIGNVERERLFVARAGADGVTVV